MKEVTLHIAIVAQVVRPFLRQEWIFWHTPNGELRDNRTGARLKAQGVLPGVPDLLFLSDTGGLHAMEIKTDNGALSIPQKAVRGQLVDRTIPYAVVRSVGDAFTTLEMWRALRPGVGSGA